jgi:adenosine deaminase
VTRLPLVDLHRHLEGAVRSSTIIEIARRENHPVLAAAARPRDLLTTTEPLSGLLPYLARVDIGVSAFVREDDWVRAARETVLDAFDEGLDHLELRFAPWFISTESGLPAEAVVDAVVEGAAAASSEVGMSVGLIGILLRDLGPDSALAQVGTLLSRADRFCGVDLAGNEAGYPAELFAPAFSKASDAGLHLTAHAGEAAGPQSVWQAVRRLGVERIGHGVRSVEDPQLMDHLADQGITLEVALTSNVHTKAAESYALHPIRRLVEHGVPLALATDDPRVSNVTLAQEHERACTLAGLTPQQLAVVARQSVAAAFIPVALSDQEAERC